MKQKFIALCKLFSSNHIVRAAPFLVELAIALLTISPHGWTFILVINVV